MEASESDKKAVIASALADCCEADLTDWEAGFVENISGQFEKKGFLSQKQLGVLRKIWKERVKEAK